MKRYVVDNKTGWIGVDEGEAETGWRSIRYLNYFDTPVQMPPKHLIYLQEKDVESMAIDLVNDRVVVP